MATQNTTNEQVQQILATLKKIEATTQTQNNKLEKLEHGQSITYWLLGGFLAFILFVAGLLFFTWGDVKNLQADVEVQQELAELRAQLQNQQDE